jgi:predicted nucleotidyltransferase
MINQKQAQEQLNSLLQKWVNEHFKKFPHLMGVLQFGSTLKSPIKHSTDLDLLFIFEKLPKSKWSQFQLTKELENKLNTDLKTIVGYHLEVSFILRDVSQLDHLSSFYLDFIEHSKIWYDPKGFLAQLLLDIQGWIVENGSHKVKKGQLWYWVYSTKGSPGAPISFQFTKKKLE